MQPGRARVTGSEQIGPYTLLRVTRGSLEPGIPGQFFMLEAPGRPLPRPMSLCLAPPGELAFLIDPIGAGTRALCALQPGEGLAILGPLGNGYRLDVERPLLVGGGIGIAPLPYLSDALGHPPALLGFRSERHAEAAHLVPNAEVVLEPTYVTEAIPAGYDVLACGPEPMLAAVARLEPAAQLAWEAPGCVSTVPSFRLGPKELATGCSPALPAVRREAHEDSQRLGLPRRADGACGGALPGRLRDEDRHTAAP